MMIEELERTLAERTAAREACERDFEARRQAIETAKDEFDGENYDAIDEASKEYPRAEARLHRAKKLEAEAASVLEKRRREILVKEYRDKTQEASRFVWWAKHRGDLWKLIELDKEMASIWGKLRLSAKQQCETAQQARDAGELLGLGEHEMRSLKPLEPDVAIGIARYALHMSRVALLGQGKADIHSEMTAPWTYDARLPACSEGETKLREAVNLFQAFIEGDAEQKQNAAERAA